jgi:hypothetical protein
VKSRLGLGRAIEMMPRLGGHAFARNGAQIPQAHLFQSFFDHDNLSSLALLSTLRETRRNPRNSMNVMPQSEASRLFKLLLRRDSVAAPRNDSTTQPPVEKEQVDAVSHTYLNTLPEGAEVKQRRT